MTDRELLELSAKAADIELWHEDVFTKGLTQKISQSGILCWNPLTDDGDALRLAVKLQMHVNVYPTKTSVTADGVYLERLHDIDSTKATRRAITCAAAEIGKENHMTDKEALKLALEALEYSVDLVREDAYNAEKLYGNYPSRQGKVAGLKVLADDHEKAITAIKQALAAPVQEPVCDKDPQGCWSVRCQLGKKCKNTPPAQPAPVQEPVAWRWTNGKGWLTYGELPHDRFESTPLYTTPPAAQRQHLTDGSLCWCEPETSYTDPETGASVIVHKGPQ